VDGRVRSALSKFGDNNLKVIEAIRDGSGAQLWQAQGATPEAIQLVKDADLSIAPVNTAGALVWYLRNSVYFGQGLDRRSDVLLLSYDRLTEAPEREMRRLCAFLGAEYRPEMIEGIDVRGPRKAAAPLELDPLVRRRCQELEERLEAACAVPIPR